MSTAPPSLDAFLLQERLVEEGVLREARRTALRTHVHLVEVLVDEHTLDEEVLASALGKRLGLPRARLGTVDAEAVRELPHDLATAHLVIPLSVDSAERALTVAMVNPLDAAALRDVTESTGHKLSIEIATIGDVRVALPRWYSSMITRMIPRAVQEEAREVPATQPHLQLPDERSVELRLRALVDILVERGVLKDGEWEERIKRLTRGDDV